MRNITFAHVVCAVVVCALAGAEQRDRVGLEERERLWRNSSLAGLNHIAMTVLVARQPVEELLACGEPQEDRGIQVSAEKVFGGVLARLSAPEQFLVHSEYALRVTPLKPDAETVAEKWGSSYQTWCMPRDKWKLATEFLWYDEPKGTVVRFPVLWDKRPELCGGIVPVLTIDGTTDRVPFADLGAYLRAARHWVEPGTQPVEEVLRMLGSGSVEKRISGVRLLGARRDEEHIPAVAERFKDERMEVRGAAAWALGMIGGREAISHLQASTKDPSSSVREEVASALGRIGGAATVQPLALLLKDADAMVRRKAAMAMGATGSEKAVSELVDSLGDQDRATRQAALESLIQLGWRPAKP